MLLSMTGQGVSTASADGTTVTVEIRAVNNRHLKINLRAPDSLIALESAIEKTIRNVVRRGTINVNIRVDKLSLGDDYVIDTQLLRSFRSQLQADLGVDVEIDTLLSLPGVIVNRSSSQQNVPAQDLIQSTLRQTLDAFQEMRSVEGAALRDDLVGQLRRLSELLENVRSRAPLVVEKYSDRLSEKLNHLLEKHHVTLTDSDIAREVGIFADKCDITEEVVRLDSHIAQFQQVMESDESQGRKLDFISQELFREVNTIGAKANDAEIANSVVEAKTVIERIREQVQNIE